MRKTPKKPSQKRASRASKGLSKATQAGKKSATQAISRRLHRSPDVLARRAQDGVISVLRLDDDRYFYQIDGIAAEFWQLMNGKRTLEQIKRKLILKHKPPLARFEQSVTRFLADLRREKLIEG